MVAQHCECTKCHWYVHFRLIHCVLNSFDLTCIKKSSSKKKDLNKYLPNEWMNEQETNQYVWPWKQITLKVVYQKAFFGSLWPFHQPHVNHPIWGVSKHWSSIALGVHDHFWWPELSFITLLMENRRQSLGSYQGKKIFLCRNFQNLLFLHS